VDAIFGNIIQMAKSGSTVSKSLTSLATSGLKQQITTFQSSLKAVLTMLGILTPMSDMINADLVKPLENLTKVFNDLSDSALKFSEKLPEFGNSMNSGMVNSIKSFSSVISSQLGQIVTLITTATSAFGIPATSPYITSLNKLVTLISNNAIAALGTGVPAPLVAVLPNELLNSLNDLMKIAIQVVQLSTKNLPLLATNLVTSIDKINGIASIPGASMLSIMLGAVAELQIAAATVGSQLAVVTTDTMNIANSAITTLSSRMTSTTATGFNAIATAINMIPNAFLTALDVMNANVDDLVASVRMQAVNITPAAIKELNAAAAPLILAMTPNTSSAKKVACSNVAQTSYNAQVIIWNTQLVKCNEAGLPKGIALKTAGTTLSTQLLDLNVKFSAFINSIINQKYSDVKPNFDALFTTGPGILLAVTDAVSQFQSQLNMNPASALQTIQTCVDGVVVINKAALNTIVEALKICAA
jgi:hypothetical protein